MPALPSNPVPARGQPNSYAAGNHRQAIPTFGLTARRRESLLSSVGVKPHCAWGMVHNGPIHGERILCPMRYADYECEFDDEDDGKS